MMDLYCKRCGEPWSNDCIHDEVDDRARLGIQSDYTQVAREFRRIGCGAFWAFAGKRGPEEAMCERVSNDRTAAAGALYDLLGDDMDGAASMFEDLGF